MKIKLLVLSVILNLSINAETLLNRVNQIDSRLTDVELLTLFNKFRINGQIINHWESYNEQVNYGSSQATGESVYTFSTILELDINFNLTKRLSFYSRLGMSKFWNNENNPGAYKHSETDDSWDTSNQGSFGYWGSSPKFDRAYLSYTATNSPLTFAIGRMPTHKGPPGHQQMGDKRTGTYPVFAYNAIFDGIALSYNFKKLLPKYNKLEARIFYTPFVNISEGSRTDNRTVTDSAGNKQKAQSLTTQYNIQLDYSNNKFKDYAKIKLIYFYYNYKNFFQYVPNDDLYLYDARAHFGYLGLENILRTNLNVNLSYLRVHEDEKITGTNEKSYYSSYGFLAGINYEFETGLLRNYIIGTERIETSPDFYIDDWTYYTLSDFYRVPNNRGSHYYISFPVFDLTRLKLGLFKYKTKGAISTDADTAKKKVDSIYATLKTSF